MLTGDQGQRCHRDDPLRLAASHSAISEAQIPAMVGVKFPALVIYIGFLGSNNIYKISCSGLKAYLTWLSNSEAYLAPVEKLDVGLLAQSKGRKSDSLSGRQNSRWSFESCKRGNQTSNVICKPRNLIFDDQLKH